MWLAFYLVFVLLYVFLFVRSTISQPPVRFTPNFACGRSLGRDVSSPLLGVSDPLGGKKRGNDTGVVSFVHRTATISIFLSDAKCSPICRAQTCAHYGIEPSRSSKAFLQGGPKSSKKFRIFHRFETLCPYISETIKIEASKQRMEKSFISPLSKCRMCLDHRSRGSIGWAKKWVT